MQGERTTAPGSPKETFEKADGFLCRGDIDIRLAETFSKANNHS